jgi:hypothetical protein
MAEWLTDTSADAERVQIDLLRAATPERRFALLRSLTSTVIRLSREAIRAQAPGLTDEEVRLRWAEIHYGRDLADRVRRHLAERRR